MTEEALRAFLTEDAEVAAVVSARIYPVKAPQGGALPAIVFALVSNVPESQLDAAPIRRRRYQVDCMAASYDAARDLAMKVSAALDYAGGTEGDDVILGVFLLSEQDLYDDSLEVYVRSQDYEVISRAAAA